MNGYSKFLVVLLFLNILFFPAFGQTTVLSVHVPDSIKPPIFGPNAKHYVQVPISYGVFPAKKTDGLNYMAWGSADVNINVRYKYKVAKNYALGADLSFGGITFGRPNKDEEVLLEEISLLNPITETITINYLGLDVFQRFTMGGHGKNLGIFLDMGGFCQLTLFSQHYYKYKPSDPDIKKVIVKENGLNYVEQLNYGFMVRAGYNKISLFAKYYATELFTTEGMTVYPLIFGLDYDIF